MHMLTRALLFLLTAIPASLMAEVQPARSLDCFPGAIYRKAVSSYDEWTGIEAVVTLPEFHPDPSRTDTATGKCLDNPSVYLGGRAGEQEVDAGVSWEVVREPDGSISSQRKAYRPFWRSGQWHSGPAQPDFYYYPGDRIRLRVHTVSSGRLQMSVELLERGEKGRSADAKYPRAHNHPEEPEEQTLSGLSADSHTSLTINFDAPGFGPGRLQEFKRVNALDQFGQEGRQTLPTRTSVGTATWEEVWLLRKKERLPMTPQRFTDMRCPDPTQIFTEKLGSSGEIVAINATGDSN